MDLPGILHSEPLILTEGAVIERLRREHPRLLHPEVLNAACIERPSELEILKTIYTEYIDLAWAATLPMLVFTPTWRASYERLKRSRMDPAAILRGAVRFLDSLRAGYGAFGEKVLIGGLMGPRGDAYKASETLGESEALLYHTPQAEYLTRAGADFLAAATLPALPEAVGLARAMAGAGIPYILSFLIRADGNLLDGTPLHEAITRIDQTATPRPAAYMLNCVHPSVARDALENTPDPAHLVQRRLAGIQANTSRKSPEELEGSPVLDTEDPEEFAKGMVYLKVRHGLKILGGCCGTDQRHIRAIIQESAHP